MLNSGKKISRFARQKKINILTFVLFEKKILNEAKNHNPPLQVKWSVPNKPILIICVYMPTSGGSEKTIEYHETVDLLNELLQRYQNTYYIVIGGDINEDLSSKAVNSRKKYILDFIDEYNLIFTMDRKSFVNSKGQDCFEIDYFLVDASYTNTVVKRRPY